VIVDLHRRVALITGACQGIGKAIALAFAQNGALVAVNDINPNGEKTAEEIRRRGGEARFFLADVGDAHAVNQMTAEVTQAWGQIDILVNNAAVYVAWDHKSRLPIHQYADSDWSRILRVDLDGVFYCSRAVSAGFVERGKGVIINIGSVVGIIPLRLQCAYGASKAAVLNLTRCHALEVGRRGIRVNAIAPGSTLTDATREMFYKPATRKLAESLVSHIPLGKPGSVEDIANAALYLASDDAKYVTGQVLVIDGGWTAGYMPAC
jgi:NAD(P)-dependent dehydrogenase (short-subunit alcohol dehydrogenase family)